MRDSDLSEVDSTAGDNNFFGGDLKTSGRGEVSEVNDARRWGGKILGGDLCKVVL